MYFRKNTGVTLTALSITIIVMLIISSTIIYNTKTHIRIQKIDKLYQDIENINSKIDEYYLKYGELPILGDASYCNRDGLSTLLNNNAQTATLITKNNNIVNPNDGDEYYVIDLEKLNGLVLNYGYGDDYKSAKNTGNISTDSIIDVYIINKVTHQIYYPKGIILNGLMYYTYDLDSNKINL